MLATYTDQTHTALADVDHGEVVFYTIEAQEPGFSWDGGGQMPLPEAHTLEGLWRSGFIETLPAQNVGERIDHRRQVELTEAGEHNLTAWGAAS